jgi:hypothetical protein
MNFMVFKNNRPAGTLKFASYEAARQYARKLCRRQKQRSLFDTSNPMIGNYGYSVKAV